MSRQDSHWRHTVLAGSLLAMAVGGREAAGRGERGLRLEYRWGCVRSVTLLWLPAVPEPWR
jgi:hypothetical protein